MMKIGEEKEIMSLLGNMDDKVSDSYYIALDGDQKVSHHNGSSSVIVHESTPQQLNEGETTAPINGLARAAYWQRMADIQGSGTCT